MEPSPSSSGSLLPVSDGSLPVRVGAFRVLRRIATGGTSDVLLARAEGPHGFERVVVLKLLLQEYRDDKSFERMFAREAAAYARLSHPAIVKLFDFFSDDGQLVMVLEYVDGLPLHKLRALLKPRGLPFDDSAAMFVAWRIFDALSAAHSAKDPQTGEFSPVIHRDVNPSNVLIPWDGQVKIADFGIAKVAGVDVEKTQAGFIKGTYGYMAPEQVRGEALTVRADVYAACLLFWELLTGRKAIVRGSASDLQVLRAMAEPTFPSLAALRPDLPPAVLDAVGRGLEPDPDRRSIQAEELAATLRAAVGMEQGRQRLVDALAGVRPPSPVEQQTTTISKRPIARPPDSSADATIPNPVTLRATPAPPGMSPPRPPVATLRMGNPTSAPPPPVVR
ncbi:MAG TPA: serine/threonine-protein kinase, partial [Polyangiaceae bacterium]